MTEAFRNGVPPVQTARVLKIFQHVDSDGDGTITLDEFQIVLNKLNPAYFKEKPLDALFIAADADNDGKLNFEEFLNFLFVGDKKGIDLGESETDEDSSSSSSEDGGSRSGSRPGSKQGSLAPVPEQPERANRTKKKSISRSLRHEEPPTTPEEMYELLTMRDGYTGGKLRLKDFVAFFAQCKQEGLGLDIARLVSQECDTAVEHAEDLMALDMAHLYLMLRDTPEASVHDAKKILAALKDRGRASDARQREERESAILELGLSLEDPIGFNMFRKFLELMTGIMGIDEAHLLAAFAWTRTCRFEMTEAMAAKLMDVVFLKVGKPHILEQPITQNDFVRMCHAMGIIDRTEKKGLAQGKAGLVFNQIIKHLPRALLYRELTRYSDRGKFEKKPRKRKHSHERIRGRTQLSILMEELFKAIPNCYRQWSSPLVLVLMFLKKGAEGDGSRLQVRI